MHSIRQAIGHVQTGRIGVFGIRPTHPNPGFGYIIRGKKLSERTSDLSSFIEKPSKERAQELIDQSGALWNSGLYFMTNETLIQEAFIHARDMLEISKETVRALRKDGNHVHVDALLYDRIEPLSIDKAISEKSDKLVVIETFIGWTDLGSWSSVHKEFEKDKTGTICRGDVIALNTENSYVESTHRLVTVYGLKDIAVIETKDAVAVFPLSESDNVKLIVQELDRNKREETVS
jgi:mannose-1-phosphate guanylyltransferase